MFVRRWNGSGFDPAVTIGRGASPDAHLFADAGGRLHAVWPTGFSPIDLIHAVSDDGTTWRSGVAVSQAGTDKETGARVATAADHIGVAVWYSQHTSPHEVRLSAVGPDAPPGPVVPPPPPPPPPPVEQPQVSASPVPAFRKTVVVRPLSGTVRVLLPPSKRFVDLTGVDDIPLGSSIDVRQGRIELSSVPSVTGAVQTVRLSGGIFRVTQGGAITDLKLNQALAPCRRRSRADARKPTSRRLSGEGQGNFRISGRYGSATIRGATRWLVEDSCAGTRTRVESGAAAVRDKVRRKTATVRAGKRYTARPRRR
jgi:hypothetical protein